MRVFIPIWIAEAVFAGLFIVTGYPQSTKKSFVFKMIACALFLANGVYAQTLADKTYGVIMIVGLACGWLGDVFLALEPFVRRKENKKLSLALMAIGGSFFLAGHVAYMAAFLRALLIQNAFRFLPFAIVMGAVLVCFALVFRLSKVSAGKFIVPIAVYAVVLAGMVALSICTTLLSTMNHSFERYVMIAAPLLFAFSDVTLALRCADKERFESLPMRAVCLTAYFLAQMLFGLSVWIYY